MAWLRVFYLAVATVAFLEPTNGSVERKKMLFTDSERMKYFLRSVITSMSRYEIIKSSEEDDKVEELEFLLEMQQGKKASKIRHAFALKFADIIADSVEDTVDVNYKLEIAIQCIASAFEDADAEIDENFLETVRDMVSVLYNKDEEEKIEEAEEKAAKVLEIPKILTPQTISSDSQKTDHISVNQIKENDLESKNIIQEQEQISDNEAFEDNSEAVIDNSYRTYSEEGRQKIGEQSQMTYSDTTSQVSSRVVSINYQSIISSVTSYLMSSDSFSAISSESFTSQEIGNAVSSGLSQHGIQIGIAQSAVSRYLSSIASGSTREEYASAIASAVSYASQKAGVVSKGQETSFSQSVSASIIQSISVLASRKSRPQPRPVHRPAPRPLPAPRRVVEDQSALYSESDLDISSSGISSLSQSTYSDSQSSASDTLSESSNVAVQSEQSASGYSSVALSSEISSEVSSAAYDSAVSSSTISKASSNLISAAASERISGLSRSLGSILSSGEINYSLISSSLASVANQISRNTNLSQAEVMIEAVLEVLIGLLCSFSSSSVSVVSTAFAQSLLEVMG